MVTCIDIQSNVVRQRVVYGRSLAQNKHLTKAQLAVLAADLVDGQADLLPTVTQVAAFIPVSRPYIAVAQKLSRAERDAILAGDKSVKLVTPRRVLALPAPKAMSDQDLIALAHKV